MYLYDSRVGYVNREVGGTLIPNRVIPKNIPKGIPIFGWIPKKNYFLNKASLFDEVGLWENNNGIGVKGMAYKLDKEGEEYDFKTNGEYAVIYHATSPILAGDVILIKSIPFNVLEAHGVFNSITETFEIDVKLGLALIERVPTVFVSQNVMLQQDSLINIDILNLVENAITTALTGASNGGGPVAFPGLVGVAPLVASTLATIQAKEQVKEEVKL